jgi:large subunit ribosomal protein L7e
MLHIVELYVTRGVPNLKSARGLILRCGQAKVKSKTIPLTDNKVVGEDLGRFGVICLEYNSHKIPFSGKYFQEIAWFLCPCHLSDLSCYQE